MSYVNAHNHHFLKSWNNTGAYTISNHVTRCDYLRVPQVCAFICEEHNRLATQFFMVGRIGHCCVKGWVKRATEHFDLTDFWLNSPQSRQKNPISTHLGVKVADRVRIPSPSMSIKFISKILMGTTPNSKNGCSFFTLYLILVKGFFLFTSWGQHSWSYEHSKGMASKKCRIQSH